MELNTLEAAAGWKRAHISEVRALMVRHSLTIADIQENGIIEPMVNIARTQTPHQPSGNTVAGE